MWPTLNTRVMPKNASCQDAALIMPLLSRTDLEIFHHEYCRCEPSDHDWGEFRHSPQHTSNSDIFTTNATFWRVLSSPGGPGHVLYLKSELTEARWRIYSDNIAMARWLQSTVPRVINAELLDLTIAVMTTLFQQVRWRARFLDRTSGHPR